MISSLSRLFVLIFLLICGLRMAIDIVVHTLRKGLCSEKFHDRHGAAHAHVCAPDFHWTHVLVIFQGRHGPDTIVSGCDMITVILELSCQ